MQKRKLGKSGLEIAPLMFGGNVFGWTVDEATSFKLLDAFVAAGFDAIDTADVYSKWVPGNKGGESETIIGKWLKARGDRDKVVIATKVGMEMPGVGQGLRKAYIMARVEDSLKRLQTDYIDLYQSHVDDKATPLEETLGAYETAHQAGQGARHRRLQLRRAAPRRGAARPAPPRSCRATRRCSRTTISSDRADFESDAAAAVREGERRRHPLLRAGHRLPHRQVPRRRRTSARARAAAACKKYLNERGLRILAALDEVSARLRRQAGARSRWPG